MSGDLEQLEQDFLESWDTVENLFGWINQTRIKQNIVSLLNLISAIRNEGYGKKLRAGQQLDTFIVSRSKHNGLKKGFSSIRIDANSDGSMKVTKRFDDTSSEYYFKTIELHTKLIEMLDELASRPIDTWQPNK